MYKERKSVLVIGFNSRPLASSLSDAGYDVYVVDFFGDLDLYPLIKDAMILTHELGKNYESLKHNYGKYLAKFAIDMVDKYPEIDYLIIGSGLDDALQERFLIKRIIKEKNPTIKYVNNNNNTIKKARDLKFLYGLLEKKGFEVPKTITLEHFLNKSNVINFPIVLKKKTGAGGINVYKIENRKEFEFSLQNINEEDFDPKQWWIQEYLEGIPVSSTIISNGKESEIISINRQIIGMNYLNPPKRFMYCGNIVPGNVLKTDEEKISQISLYLAKFLRLKGINGFDFVLKNHHPYLMEINPRIPGSINASELAYDLNLLEMHVISFNKKKWNEIKRKLKGKKLQKFATKLIFFAPEKIKTSKIHEINNLKYIQDKTVPEKEVFKGEPLCTILYGNQSFNSSFFGALKIIDKIYHIIKKQDFKS